MENKINIAELLKDCPKGMELDCTSYDNVSFDKISDDKKATYPIFCYITDKEGNRSSISFTENGCESKRYGAKCVIFPKGKTTWDRFQRPFKDGDVVTYKYENGLVSMILNKFVNFVRIHYHCALYDNAKGFVTNNYIVGEPKYTRLATEEEKQKLFDAIKANGYKWNSETKTLEELIKPKFKVGDRIRKKGDYISGYITIIDIDNFYKVEYDKGGVSYVNVEAQDDWELAPDKFDINTLVPFESKVLVSDCGRWMPAVYGGYNESYAKPFFVIGGNCFSKCIPYEGNQHLLGTTKDCDEYYKTWEK